MNPIPISMTVRTWQAIDGEMDNVSQTAYEDGDDQRGDLAIAIREAGWDATGGEGPEWPPGDHVLTVTLTQSRWAFVVRCIKESDPVYRRLGDVESLELGRKALAAIEPHLS